MNTAKYTTLALAAMILAPARASAHFTTEMGSFYGGMLHPVTDGMMLLPILIFGIWASQQATGTAGKMILMFTLVLPVGAWTGQLLPGPVQAPALGALFLTGMMIIRSFRPSALPAATLAVLLGMAAGYINGADAGAGSEQPWRFVMGLSLGAGLTVLYTTGFLLSRKQRWHPAAIRLAGGILAGGGIVICLYLDLK